MKSTKEEAFERVRKAVKELSSTLKKEKNKIWLRLETTGKPTQFGNLAEILKLSGEFDNVMPCIDFAHMHARTNGGFNTYKKFCGILDDVEKTLGKEGLKNLHIHLTGIEYGEKGEKHHLTLDDSDLKWKELLKALKDHNACGVVISESPNVEKDALLAQKLYSQL